MLQVAGLGYSNELIEHAFKNRDEEDDVEEKKTCDHPEIHFRSVSSTSSSATSPVPSDGYHGKVKHFPPLTKPRS